MGYRGEAERIIPQIWVFGLVLWSGKQRAEGSSS